MPAKTGFLDDDPFWYKDAIIYETHVRTFYDTNGDGVGDFRGLTEKLDYLKDLGVTAIWLLPFYPSPLKDDGYDIADYFDIHPDYGTLRDFREFLRAAHSRGLRVITELVINHTSDQNIWFQRSRKANPGTVWRDFYVWNDTPEKYRDARIIFKDFETSNWAWDRLARQYYWHRFYSHQPDLNFDSPNVQRAIFRVLEFWLGMGVDGLRLDAVPYLYEREGTNCENLSETHAFLKKLRAYVDRNYKNRMLLAEANQWPEDAVAYFGGGDECHMAFHFPLMPRMFMAVQAEDRFPIIDILEQTPQIPENCQWALFLRNHDELTLEMVTDEERDYMYRVYAKDPRAKINLGIRRRLAPLLDNNRRKIELMNILLFSMPGTPVIYYGDEIGMGDNYYLGDRNGVRTPMQWGPDRNAGFSTANPQKLYLPVIIDPEYHYEALNVENQDRNVSSLLWWMKRSIAMRKRFKAFGRGNFEFLGSSNPKVLTFLRTWGDENIIVTVNLSRFNQVAELDFSRFAGYTPEDVFSRNKFPVIKEQPYVLTFGPHWYHMFLLQKEPEIAARAEEKVYPVMETTALAAVFDQADRLENYILPQYLRKCRWFGGKGRLIRTLSIIEYMPSIAIENTRFALLEVQYTEGLAEIYQIMLSVEKGDKAREIAEDFPQAVVARVRAGDESGILYDGIYSEGVRNAIFRFISRKKRIKGLHGEISALRSPLLRQKLPPERKSLPSQVMRAEQSNTSVIYGNVFFLKIPRRLEAGLNPDLEIVRFLTERAGFRNVPHFAGAIEYRETGSEPIIMAILHEYIQNEGVAWNLMLEGQRQYLEQVLSKRAQLTGMPTGMPKVPPSLLDIDFQKVPAIFMELIGGYYLELAALLGKRTAELHLALASDSELPDFAPEPFSILYQRAVYQSMRSMVRRVFQLLGRNIRNLPENIRAEAESILSSEQEILKRQQRILQKKLLASRIRIHGDYHLGQVLYTGKDFYIIDFEGEPARSLSERRLKKSALRDVAGMMRSFHYVSYAGFFHYASIRPEDVSYLEPWAELWPAYVSAVFLDSYLKSAGKAPFLPLEKAQLPIMLDAFLLDKAVYELGYELNNRPDWVIIPLRGITNILKAQS